MEDRPVTTTIRMDRRTWELLRELAFLRAQRLGGRPSQAAVVAELIAAAKPEGAGNART